ncbi:MAG: hypothetical protein V9G09_13920 [Candidatus Nanopelagicales bacterium]
MTITVTDPDTALDGLRSQVDQLLAMDPAEWTLDQLQRTILDVHTLTQQLAAVQAKALAVFRYPRRRPVGRAPHHGGLAGDIDPHPGGACRLVGPHRPRAA